MSSARAVALLCAYALFVNVASKPSPAPPKKTEIKETKMVPDVITVKRAPMRYFYPFSLWPLPKYPMRERADYEEDYRFRRDVPYSQMRQNQR